MAQHNDFGKKGEALAIAYLQKNGYKIIEKNYRYLKAEVDIIAQINNVLIAVEVKTRSSIFFWKSTRFCKSQKIKLMVQAMDFYVNQNQLDVEVRFDIVAVLINNQQTEIEHITDAFLYF
ncbi:MAG: endonuclease [Polaribacter sp.]|nr:endonuclease [Polaribacter sp.]